MAASLHPCIPVSLLNYMPSVSAPPAVPRPYYAVGFSGAQRRAAQAFWDWHAVTTEAPPTWQKYATEALRTLILEARPVPDVPDALTQRLYRHAHEQGIPLEVFAQQVESAVGKGQELRFSTYQALERFMQHGVCRLSEALMHLLDMANRFQLPQAQSFARALFLISRLMRLPQDVRRGRLFIPLDALAKYGIEEHRLFRGEVNEALRRVLWRLTVRARDELAQAEPLAADLPWRARGVYKRYWIGGLDVLARIERRDFDVWSNPIQINRVDRFRIRLQALFNRSALGG